MLPRPICARSHPETLLSQHLADDIHMEPVGPHLVNELDYSLFLGAVESTTSALPLMGGFLVVAPRTWRAPFNAPGSPWLAG